MVEFTAPSIQITTFHTLSCITGGLYTQDGGILTNNPCGIAIHEARLLWGKNAPIQTILSLGTGLYKKTDKQPLDKEITSTSLKEKIIKVVAGATDTESEHDRACLRPLFITDVHVLLCKGITLRPLLAPPLQW